jgi:hypothetical protein
MIYSANYGSWDPPRTQPVPVRMFTEATHPITTTAPYIRPAATHGHPGPNQTQNRLDAKWWKLRPDLACPESAVTIWIDASVTILRADFANLCLAELGEDDALFMRHPWRKCIYAEAIASQIPGLQPKYGGQPIAEQVGHYRAEGHPERWGLVQSTVLVRRNNERVRAFDAAWWAEIIRWSIQDQISLPVVLRRLTKRRLRWHYWPVHPIAAGWLRWGEYNA